MEAEGNLSRGQFLAHIFETAEEEDWSDEKLRSQFQSPLESWITPEILKHIMGLYRAYKYDERITKAQWHEVQNAWRDKKASITGPYKSLLYYEYAKRIERLLGCKGIEGLSVQWKTSGDYEPTVKSITGYLELRGPSAAILATIEIIEGETDILNRATRDFLEKLRQTERLRRSVFG